MLLHIVPRVRAFRASEPEVRLVDVRCDALGLLLRDGIELTARHPYPNKNYLVACRKVGQCAINGILIEVDRQAEEFVVATRWAVGAERVVTHRVRYFVLDDDFDAMTEDMTLWYGRSEPDWASRWPEWAAGIAPIDAQPLMEVVRRTQRAGTCVDRVEYNNVVERSEVFQVPTVERARISPAVSRDRWYGRLPSLGHAFKSDSR
ncbi:MAG: DUF6012 family protein [Dokdonella sp.]